MNWPLAAVLTDESAGFRIALARAVARGFSHVEVAGLADRPAEHLEALADAGVFVPCATLTVPAGGLDRRVQLRMLTAQLTDAARLGARCVVLAPAAAESGEEGFTELCALLGPRAAGCMLRLAVEPLPGSCLPDAAAVRRWLEGVPVANLGLALTGADADEVRRAGEKLFHLRQRDPSPAAEIQAALAEIGYQGVVGVLLSGPGAVGQEAQRAQAEGTSGGP